MLVGVVALCVFMAACATDEAPGDSSECTSDDDCSDGEVCDDDTNRCIVDSDETCRDDDDCVYSECQDDYILVHYTGRCQGEEERSCSSSVSEVEDCPAGCSDGACEEDECEKVTCDEPPAPECEDDVTRVTYEGEGACRGGECEYEESVETCQSGCSGGECVDPCDGEQCEQPTESPRCEGNTGVVQETPGECRTEAGGEARCYFDWVYNNCDYTNGVCDEQTGECEDEIEQAGGGVIVEYMAHPRRDVEARGEWFEIVNTSGEAIDLSGWTIESANFYGGDDEVHQIQDPPAFPDGARLMFARSEDPAGDGSVEPDYRYHEVTLQNPSDTIELINDEGDVVDFVYWEEASIMEGRSRMLDPDVDPSVENNDDFEHWCPAMEGAYGDGENYGTPRASNAACESEPCVDYTCEKPDDYCNPDGNAVQHTADDATCEVSQLNNPFCDYEPETVDCSESETCVEGGCEELRGALPGAGDLVVTELMGNPEALDDENGEYIEVYNASDEQISLHGLTIEDDESGTTHDEFTVDDPDASVRSNEYAVFAQSVDEADNGGISGAYRLEDSPLKNSPPDDGLTIHLTRDDGTLIDSVYYGEPTPGAAQQLDADVYLDGAADPASVNDTADAFCDATEARSGYTSGDLGSPGADNESCDGS